MIKNILKNIICSAVICAPAYAMSPAIKHAAKMVMNRNIRSALTQAGKITAQELTSAAPQTERRLMTIAQSNTKSISNQLSNAGSLAITRAGITSRKNMTRISRSFSTSAAPSSIFGDAFQWLKTYITGKPNNEMQADSGAKGEEVYSQELSVENILKELESNVGYGRVLSRMKIDKEFQAELVQMVAENFIQFVEHWGSRDLIKEMMKHDAAAQKTFTDLAVQNFMQLAEHLRGRDLIKEMMKHDAATQKTFIDLAIQNFMQLYKSYGSDLIIDIMQRDAVTQKIFTDLAMQNFMLADTWGGRDIIKEMMKSDTATQKTFTDLAVQNFMQLAHKNYGSDLIKEIMQRDIAMKPIFMSLAEQNFMQLANQNMDFINEMIKSDAAAQKTFTDLAVQNFMQLAGKSYGSRFIRKMIHQDAAVKPIFMNLAEQNFVQLANKWGGRDLIEEMMKSDTAAQKTFTDLTVQHFMLLANIYGISDLIKEMIQHNAAVKPLFMKLTEQNFVQLVPKGGGRNLIMEMMKSDAAAQKTFTDLAAQHFVQLADDYGISDLIKKMMHQDAAIKPLFMNLAEQNFVEFTNKWSGRDLIKKMMKSDAEAQKKFTDLTVQNFMQLAEKWGGRHFITEMMQCDAKTQEVLVKEAAQKILQLVDIRNGTEIIEDAIALNKANQEIFEQEVKRVCTINFHEDQGPTNIKKIMVKCPQFAPLFTDLVITHLEKICDKEPAMVTDFMNNAGMKGKIKQRAKELVHNEKNNKNVWIKALASEDPVLTQKYLLCTYKNMHEKAQTDLKDLKVADLVDKTIAIEQQWQKDYYTFEHGKRWAYKLPEMAFRFFWPLANDKTVPDDFMFTHTKPHIYNPRFKAEEFEQEKALSTQVINEHENIPGEVRNRRLFMNTGLLGNINSWGSSSLYYVLDNYNQADARVSMKSIFEQFGLQALYEKHKERCEALEKEAIALSNWGQLLVLGIPKEKISDFVTYLCIVRDPKPKIKIGNEETYDVKRILDARLENPSLANNDINWIAAMTDNALLDPYSGVKIKAVENPNDMAAFKAWEMKFNEFMQSISAEAKEIMDAHKKSAIANDVAETIIQGIR